jgi:hypothetical protein
MMVPGFAIGGLCVVGSFFLLRSKGNDTVVVVVQDAGAMTSRCSNAVSPDRSCDDAVVVVAAAAHDRAGQGWNRWEEEAIHVIVFVVIAIAVFPYRRRALYGPKLFHIGHCLRAGTTEMGHDDRSHRRRGGRRRGGSGGESRRRRRLGG